MHVRRWQHLLTETNARGDELAREVASLTLLVQTVSESEILHVNVKECRTRHYVVPLVCVSERFELRHYRISLMCVSVSAQPAEMGSEVTNPSVLVHMLSEYFLFYDYKSRKWRTGLTKRMCSTAL